MNEPISNNEQINFLSDDDDWDYDLDDIEDFCDFCGFLNCGGICLDDY